MAAFRAVDLGLSFLWMLYQSAILSARVVVAGLLRRSGEMLLR